MRAKKISMLLAVIVGAGMILAGITSAAPVTPDPSPDENSIYLEIQASSKGYEADTDNNIGPGTVYDEDKHTLKVTLHAMCDRTTGYFRLAYYNEASTSWMQQSIQINAETEKNLLMKISGMIPIHADSDGIAILTTGTLRVQFKVKDDTVKSAKLKSLAMSYWQSKTDAPANTQLIGALKMKGKMRDPGDLPGQVQVLFGLLH